VPVPPLPGAGKASGGQGMGWSGESAVAGGGVCSTGNGVLYTEGNAAGVGGGDEEEQ
jgi:hypothetical protein